MINYLKEMRMKHWIKNFLILLPLLCSGNFICNITLTINCLFGWLAFGFLSSSVYVINDIADREKDMLHPKKKFRPIASGKITVLHAACFAVILVVLALITNSVLNGGLWSWGALLLYYIVNLLYSLAGLKKIPLLDIVLLVSGFLLRVEYGSIITGIPISEWLYLVIISGAFYLGFGKRRNELLHHAGKTRDVLQAYSSQYIDKMLTVCMTLSLTFYSLWCVETVSNNGRISIMYMTIPLLMIIFFLYSLILDGNSDGDPVEVILCNKGLLILIVSFIIAVVCGIYS